MIEDVNEACSAAHAFDDKDITSAGDLCSKCSAARGMTPWLEADLGQHYLIAYVNIAGRLNRGLKNEILWNVDWMVVELLNIMLTSNSMSVIYLIKW
ncbi:hypothetical protein DPMN_103677 [Dreissena polymorpha]|uniref:Uncharacterized protein n=1 Tax=Dreissena polymorpha TaxID=45954 RepID=A0A9D4K2Q9_DREPO|nr:hypothetical protein DPMN_103677 [Dreissena polymorpha]